MECTYVLFTVDGIKSNISSYLLLIIIYYFLFSITTFIKCGYPLLKMDIQNIIAMKKKDNNQKKENKNKKNNKILSNKKSKNNGRKKINNFSPSKTNNNKSKKKTDKINQKGFQINRSTLAIQS